MKIALRANMRPRRPADLHRLTVFAVSAVGETIGFPSDDLHKPHDERQQFEVIGNSEKVRSKKMKTPSANEVALLMKTLTLMKFALRAS